MYLFHVLSKYLCRSFDKSRRQNFRATAKCRTGIHSPLRDFRHRLLPSSVQKFDEKFFLSHNILTVVVRLWLANIMRFLLHPRPLTSSIKRKVGRTGESAAKGALSVQNESLDTAHVSDKGRRTWGQQCSQNCGCVVRFEALLENQRIHHASYTAKQVVTTANRQPVLTAKGRPMFQNCHCSTLHHLSKVIVDYITNQQQHVQSLKNLSEFQQTRSSNSFRQTVLATHSLPNDHAHCFDVVEEAFTAMLKGYLPHPRPALQQQHQQPNYEYPHYAEQMESSKQGRNTTLLGHLLFWTDEEDEPDRKGNILSTLNMFDRNQQEAIEVEMTIIQRTKTKQHPRDWVSYVDELYQEQEERSA